MLAMISRANAHQPASAMFGDMGNPTIPNTSHPICPPSQQAAATAHRVQRERFSARAFLRASSRPASAPMAAAVQATSKQAAAARPR